MLDHFKTKLERIFEVLGPSVNKEDATKDLLLTLLANYLRLIAKNPKNQKILSFLSQKEITTPENFREAVEEAKEKFKDEPSSIDFDALFTQAQDETLKAYVEELKKSLPPEKIEQITSIVNS